MNCLELAKAYVKKAGLRIDEETLASYAKILEKEKAQALTSAEFNSRFDRLVEEVEERISARNKAADYINVAKRELAKDIILEGKKDYKSVRTKFRDFLEGGGIAPTRGSNRDVQRIANAVKAEFMTAWRRATEGKEKIFASRVLDREIFQELDAIQKGLPQGRSNSKEALEAAQIIDNIQNLMFERKRLLNPFMEKADDYFIRQSHNRELISKVSEDEWVDSAMKAFGKKSFAELDEVQKVEQFKSIYKRIVRGEYGTVKDYSASDKAINVAGGQANIMKRMAKHRSLIPENWEAFYEYNRQFGKPLNETILQSISRASRDIGMLDKFGTNPRGLYEGLYKRVGAFLSPEDLEKWNSIENKKYLDIRFETASGFSDAPASSSVGKFFQGFRTWEYMAKLGNSALRSLPDIFMASGLVRGLNGRTVLGNAFDIVGAYAKSVSSKQARVQGLEDLRLFSQATLSGIYRDLGLADDVGKLGKMAETYGKLNMLGLHVDSMRAAVGLVVGRNLKRLSKFEYADLPEVSKNSFIRYDIGELEWNTIRKATDDWSDGSKGAAKESLKKYKFLSPEAVDKLSDEEITSYIKLKNKAGAEITQDMIEYTRYDLSTRVATLINDVADLGSTTAGTRQKAFLLQGTTADEGLGVALRIMTQFKSAAVVSADNYRRIWFSGNGPHGDYAGVAQTMAGGMFMWALGEYAIQALQGKTPEDPLNPAFIGRAALGSGAAGLFGETLLSAAMAEGPVATRNRLMGDILGPVAGELVDFGINVKTVTEQALSEDKEVSGKAFGAQIPRNLPGLNLFYLKGALDYYFINGMKEYLGPGYIDNLDSRIQETPGLLDETQRYYMGEPTGSVRWFD